MSDVNLAERESLAACYAELRERVAAIEQLLGMSDAKLAVAAVMKAADEATQTTGGMAVPLREQPQHRS